MKGALFMEGILILLAFSAVVFLIIIELRFIIAIPSHLKDIVDELKAINDVLGERL